MSRSPSSAASDFENGKHPRDVIDMDAVSGQSESQSPSVQLRAMPCSRTYRTPQEPSATNLDFEQRLKEGISGLSTGKYSTPTEAARVLNVCKPRAKYLCILEP